MKCSELINIVKGEYGYIVLDRNNDEYYEADGLLGEIIYFLFSNGKIGFESLECYIREKYDVETDVISECLEELELYGWIIIS